MKASAWSWRKRNPSLSGNRERNSSKPFGSPQPAFVGRELTLIWQVSFLVKTKPVKYKIICFNFLPVSPFWYPGSGSLISLWQLFTWISRPVNRIWIPFWLTEMSNCAMGWQMNGRSDGDDSYRLTSSPSCSHPPSSIMTVTIHSSIYLLTSEVTILFTLLLMSPILM